MRVLKMEHYVSPQDLTLAENPITGDTVVKCTCGGDSHGHWGFIDRAALAALLEW